MNGCQDLECSEQHPTMCESSMNTRECYNLNCRRRHFLGTRRKMSIIQYPPEINYAVNQNVNTPNRPNGFTLTQNSQARNTLPISRQAQNPRRQATPAQAPNRYNVQENSNQLRSVPRNTPSQNSQPLLPYTHQVQMGSLNAQTTYQFTHATTSQSLGGPPHKTIPPNSYAKSHSDDLLGFQAEMRRDISILMKQMKELRKPTRFPAAIRPRYYQR